MRKLRLIASTVLMAAALVVSSCTPETVAQGVTDTTIKIGNAATVSGGFAVVGIPFNAGIKTRLMEANAAPIDGRTIEFVTYDDGGLASQGAQMTEKLVEDDKIFALVGHFGTWTVGQTLPYIRDKGIPMVYAATGINSLFFESSPGNPIFAVQPIYRTEGRIMVARVFKEADLFGTVAKLGVIYTTEDAGYSMLVGIEEQAATMNKTSALVKQGVVAGGDYSAAVIAMKDAGVDAVIVATNQVYFQGIVTAMAANALIKPVVTSYVSAAATYIPAAAVNQGIDIYTNAWVDILSEAGAADFATFTESINAAITAEKISALEGAYALNPALVAFAIAGYVAADVFVTGLERLAADDKVVNWENYIDALESAPVEFPLGGPIDFTNGKRHGLDSLSLLHAEYVAGETPTVNLVLAKPLETLPQIMAK
ncbi:MAG TPA: ABC transporter substrate-binding protein [Bacilli bacterium]|nr:ABC transporter substrate-binding protein [Bacilli bacterium]